MSEFRLGEIELIEFVYKVSVQYMSFCPDCYWGHIGDPMPTCGECWSKTVVKEERRQFNATATPLTDAGREPKIGTVLPLYSSGEQLGNVIVVSIGSEGYMVRIGLEGTGPFDTNLLDDVRLDSVGGTHHKALGNKEKANETE